VTQGLMVAFYVSVVALVIADALPWPALASLGALPVLAKVWPLLSQPRPDAPPEGFPIWPLWFAALAFVHTRRAGALLVAGLAVAAIVYA
jgi:1,4-dihydroxy-2-naphthoate polyprenyltransferase